MAAPRPRAQGAGSQGFAETRTARIQKDRKEAATAYRNLGAIAGLRDPKAGLDAYAKAAELDPDDAESLLRAGWLEVDHGELSRAEARLRSVLSLTTGQDWYQYWAQVALADIKVQRGDLTLSDGEAVAIGCDVSAPGRSPCDTNTLPTLSYDTARSRCHGALAGSAFARCSRMARLSR